MSARDAQRALLDELLGAERDKPVEQKTGPAPFTHPSVDKHALAGLSPREALKGTRYALPPPAQPQQPPTDAQLREYKKLSQAEKDDLGYEYDLLQTLRSLVRDCDARISQTETRILREEAERTSSFVARDVSALLQTDEVYQAQAEEVRRLALEGRMQEALVLGKDLRQFEDERNRVLQASVLVPRHVVCTVTGNLMALVDTDDRILAHFEGRAYAGWTAIRKKLAELEKLHLQPPRRKQRSASPPQPSSLRGSSREDRGSSREDRGSSREGGRRDERRRSRDRDDYYDRRGRSDGRR
jgi:hypothetical protein